MVSGQGLVGTSSVGITNPNSLNNPMGGSNSPSPGPLGGVVGMSSHGIGGGGIGMTNLPIHNVNQDNNVNNVNNNLNLSGRLPLDLGMGKIHPHLSPLTPTYPQSHHTDTSSHPLVLFYDRLVSLLIFSFTTLTFVTESTRIHTPSHPTLCPSLFLTLFASLCPVTFPVRY